MKEAILVIDDSEINLAVFSYLLGAFGYRVQTALSGPKGLEIARETIPDVVFCDVLMPGMNGYQVVKEMRADPVLARVPVVAVTALAMVDDRIKILRGGFDGYLSKPIDPTALVRWVADFLFDRRGETGRAAAVTALADQQVAWTGPTGGGAGTKKSAPDTSTYDPALAKYR
jgi:two-component system, cell cycle response regulator